MNLIKKLFLLIIFSDFLLSSTQGLEKISLQLNWKYQFEFAGFIAAKEKGFYEDVGLDVNIKEYENGIDILKNLRDGTDQFALYDFSLVSLKNEREKLKLIANYFKRSALVFVTNQNIVTPFDLKNKVIMATKGQLEVSTLSTLLKKFSITKDDFVFRDHKYTPDDFISGKVDVMSAYLSNEIYHLQKSNKAFNIIDPQMYGISGSGVNVFTSEKLILTNPELVKNFVEATNKGWKYALENKEEIVDIIYKKYSNVKEKEALLFEANQIDKLMMPSIYSIGEINKQQLQRSINNLYSEGIIKDKFFNINDIVYNITENSKNGLNFTKKQREYINNKDFVTMCIDPDWLPYEKIVNGIHYGMTSEFIPIISKNIGIPIKLIPTKSWTQSMEYAKERKCDIFSLAMASPKRLEFMNFTTPYVSFPIVIATKTGEMFISNPDSLLNDKKIGVVKGYSIAEILKSVHHDNKLVEVDNVTDGMQRVAKGELYGFIDSLPTIAYSLQHEFLGELKISGKFNYNFELGVGVRNDDEILFQLMQKAVKVIDEKTRQDILNKYVSVKVESAFDYQLFYQIGLFILVVGLFLSYRHLQLAKHNKKLQRQREALNNTNTELMDTKRKLESSIKDFEVLIDSVTEAIFIFEDDICIDANNITHAMFGYSSKNEIIGKHLKDFMTQETYDTVKQKIKSNNSSAYEVKGKKKDGTLIEVIAKGTNAQINSKNVRISAVIDITETKQKEQLLFQQSKMAAMGQMLENIAHQWRQPLSLISSLSTGIELKSDLGILDKTEEKRDLEKINQTAQHLSETIEDFRNFFKSNKETNEFSIIKAIEKNMSLMEGVFKSNDIQVIIGSKDDAVINSYENEFTQAMINIIYNAKDALVKIKQNRLLFIDIMRANKKIIISIKDNAGGIDEKIIKNIFEPYFTTKHQSQGTGIGLYMTQIIIEKHMFGLIEAKNAKYTYLEENYKGAEFIIKLSL